MGGKPDKVAHSINCTGNFKLCGSFGMQEEGCAFPMG